MDMSEEHMSLPDQLKMIEKKIRETEEYFLPAIKRLCDDSINYHQDYSHWSHIRRLLEGALEESKKVLQMKRAILSERGA